MTQYVPVPAKEILTDRFSRSHNFDFVHSGDVEVGVVKHIATGSILLGVKVVSYDDSRLSTNYRYATPSRNYGSLEVYYDDYFVGSRFLTKLAHLFQVNIDASPTFPQLNSTAIPMDIINQLQPRDFSIAINVLAKQQTDPTFAIPNLNVTLLLKLSPGVELVITRLSN